MVKKSKLRKRCILPALVPALAGAMAIISADGAFAQNHSEERTVIPYTALVYKYAPDQLSDQTLKQPLRRIIVQEQERYAQQTVAASGGDGAVPIGEDFLFRQEQIEGRAPDFAVEELLPEYRLRLRRAAERIPDTLYMERFLAPRYFRYENGVVNSKTPSGQGAGVFHRLSVAPDHEKAKIPELGPRALLRETPPLMAAVQSPDPVADFKALRLQRRVRLALDRSPVVRPIALPREEAEQAFVPPANECGGDPRLSAPGERDPEAIATFRECLMENHRRTERFKKGFRMLMTVSPESFIADTDILSMAVKKVEVFDPYDRLLVALTPADLNKPVDAFAKAIEDAEAEAARAAARRAAARARLADFDILGLKLSMSFDEAEAAVREALTVVRVRESSREGKTRPFFDDMRHYENEDGSERFMLFRSTPGGDRLVAIARMIALPEGSAMADVEGQLVEKYGDDFDSVGSEIRTWRADEDRTQCGVSYNISTAADLIEGPRPEAPQSYNSVSIRRSSNTPLAEMKNACAPQLFARVWNSHLLLVLADPGAYAAANGPDDEGANDAVQLDL